MTKKINDFLLYAKGTALSIIAMAMTHSCDKEEQISDHIKTKTEKAVRDLKEQDKRAMTVTNEIQKTLNKSNISSGHINTRSLEDKIAQQEQVIADAYAEYQKEYENVAKGENAIPDFDIAVQNYANTTALNMKILKQKAMIHHQFAINIEEDKVPEIPYSSLNNIQKTNLYKFRISAYNLEYALEIMERLTGGIERAQEQIDGIVSWIYDLSEQLIEILEQASGTAVIRDKDSGTFSAATNLQLTESLMSKVTEADLSPYSAQIDKLVEDIENVQSGLDEVLSFWEELGKTVTDGKLSAKVVNSKKSTQRNQQWNLAKKFAAHQAPIRNAQHNLKRTRIYS